MVDIPTTGLTTFIAGLARKHGVVYQHTGTSALAQVITRLSDDEGAPDATERLLIALRRGKAIDGKTMLILQGRYLDEKFHVRPVR